MRDFERAYYDWRENRYKTDSLLEMHANTFYICVTVFVFLSTILTCFLEPKLLIELTQSGNEIFSRNLREIYLRMGYVYICLGVGCLFLYAYLYNQYKKQGEIIRKTQIRKEVKSDGNITG